MSTWRRSALQHLPQHRSRIERSATTEDLWRELVSLLEAEKAESPASEQAAAVFGYAAACLSSPSKNVRRAVVELFYPYALTHRTSHLCLFLRETEWRELESLMLSQLSSDGLAAARRAFFEGLAELDDPSPATKLRRVKNRIIATVADADQATVEAAWQQAIGLLEVGEQALGLEVFVSNLDDAGVVVDADARARLGELATMWKASTLPPTAANHDNPQTPLPT